MNKKVAVVILNWNGLDFLKKFLPTLIETTPGQMAEIVIADNASADGSIEFLKSEYPHIQIILLDKNYGFTSGYNRALAQIEAEYFVLLNSDVETTNGWLEPMIEFLEKNNEYAACQPKLKSYADKKMFEYAGSAGGFLDTYGYPFCRGRILDTIEEDNAQYDEPSDIFWATGACFMIRRADWLLMQGFDELFFAHMEEIDLCWRLQNASRKIAYVPQSEVFHVGGGSLPNNSPFKLYLNHRNNLFLLYKNLPVRSKFPVLFFRLILDGLSALMYVLQGKYYGMGVVLKAHFHFYRHISQLRSQKAKQYPPTVYRKSILWTYFVKKRRKFSELKF